MIESTQPGSPDQKNLVSPNHFTPHYVFFIAAFLMAVFSIGLSRLQLDARLMFAVHRRFGVPHRDFWIAMTRIGSWEFLVPLIAITTVLLLIFKRYKSSFWLVVGAASTSFAVELLKRLVERERPPMASLTGADGFSFPSGHSAAALFVLLYLWTLLASSRFLNKLGSTKWIVTELAALLLTGLAVMVGYSRICVGAHWPSDVLGGWAVGFLFLQIALLGSSQEPSEIADSPAS